MRYSTGLVLAALSVGEVLASPTHAHLHKKAHAKKDVDYAALDWDAMGIDWTSAWAAGQKTKTSSVAAPTTTPTPTAAATQGQVLIEAIKTSSAKPSSTSSAPSTVESVINDIEGLFDKVVGASNALTKFGASTSPTGDAEGDAYRGNVGNPYGSSVIKVSSASGYDFTNTYVNSQSVSITVNVWQKVGPDGQTQSGSAMAPYNTTLTFVLAPGASQVVAFQENTQIGWAQACKSKIASGAFATTWGEANFLSKGSGYDVSAILNPNNDYAMTITSVEAPSCTSSRTENYWLNDKTPVGTSDGSCFVNAKTATLKTVMGGTI